jgi:D-3-phosphoglycerate dehydrogenase
VVDEDVRPLLSLAEKLGRVFTAVAGGVAASVTVEVRGEIVTHDVGVLKLAATKGLFASVVDERVTYVNAPQLAADRGVEVELAVSEEPCEHQNLVTVRGALPDGRRVSVSGTLTVTSTREISKLTGVDDFDLDLTADGVLLFFRYSDRPGVIGAIGSLLGESGVNIAAMQVARREVGGEALMTLTLDSSIDADLLSAVAEAIGSARGALVDLRSE